MQPSKTVHDRSMAGRCLCEWYELIYLGGSQLGTAIMSGLYCKKINIPCSLYFIVYTALCRALLQPALCMPSEFSA